MYIRKIESLNPDISRPLRDINYLTHLMHILKTVETVRTKEIKQTQERVADFVLNETDATIKSLQSSPYAIFVPPEVLQKTHYEKVSLNEKLSRLKQTLSSLSERAELSLGGLIDLMV